MTHKVMFASFPKELEPFAEELIATASTRAAVIVGVSGIHDQLRRLLRSEFSACGLKADVVEMIIRKDRGELTREISLAQKQGLIDNQIGEACRLLAALRNWAAHEGTRFGFDFDPLGWPETDKRKRLDDFVTRNIGPETWPQITGPHTELRAFLLVILIELWNSERSHRTATIPSP